MVACQNADCFRPAEPDLKLSDRRVNSGARIGSDRLRPDGESLVRLSIEKQMLGPSLVILRKRMQCSSQIEQIKVNGNLLLSCPR